MSLFHCNHSAFGVTISCMTSISPAYGRKASAVAMILFPLLFIAVFLMHFQHPSDFFHFRLHYAPRDPVKVVTSLIRAENRWPLLADPHMLGYLGLPLLPLCAYALYMLGRAKRPLLSGAALFITISGTIFLGGIFAMWTAFYRGLGNVDPQYTEGAIATFQGMTAPHGAFLLTTTLGKLAIVGFALQALTLHTEMGSGLRGRGLRHVPAFLGPRQLDVDRRRAHADGIHSSFSDAAELGWAGSRTRSFRSLVGESTRINPAKSA